MTNQTAPWLASLADHLGEVSAQQSDARSAHSFRRMSEKIMDGTIRNARDFYGALDIYSWNTDRRAIVALANAAYEMETPAC
jgi:hypothetical protein